MQEGSCRLILEPDPDLPGTSRVVQDYRWLFYCDDLICTEPGCRDDDCEHVQYDPEAIAEAKKVCANCPVQAKCDDFGIGTRQEFGIWGGRTANERASYLRKARRKGWSVPDYRKSGQ